MTAEQVLRCAILKQYRQLTYEELAFHLEDSDAFRVFSRLEMGQYPGKSILQENIKSLREETWETIHREIIGYARAAKIETVNRVDKIEIEGSRRREWPVFCSLRAGGCHGLDLPVVTGGPTYFDEEPLFFCDSLCFVNILRRYSTISLRREESFATFSSIISMC